MKTYYINDIMEWHGLFRAGKCLVTIPFTGGHMCGGARTPASFATSDKVLQKIIENSPEWASGRIYEKPAEPNN